MSDPPVPLSVVHDSVLFDAPPDDRSFAQMLSDLTYYVELYRRSLGLPNYIANPERFPVPTDEELRKLEREAFEASPAIMRYLHALILMGRGQMPAPARVTEMDVLARLFQILIAPQAGAETHVAERLNAYFRRDIEQIVEERLRQRALTEAARRLEETVGLANANPAETLRLAELVGYAPPYDEPRRDGYVAADLAAFRFGGRLERRRAST